MIPIFSLSWTLASASPRRLALLRQVGIEPTVRPADVEEELDGPDPVEVGLLNARRKLRAVLPSVGSGVVLAADTLVVLEDRILGKPEDEAGAAAMLRELAGRRHRVITAFAIADAGSGAESTGAETTHVWFRPLTESEIDAYVATGQPMDKAGAYGIQGAAAAFVPRIDGCYFNVVGLPLARVLHEAATLRPATAR